MGKGSPPALEREPRVLLAVPGSCSASAGRRCHLPAGVRCVRTVVWGYFTQDVSGLRVSSAKREAPWPSQAR
ncbi:hypothetical protein NDU88_002354 [Pleurodeles waltl]|uniref:Uncharacterized protein n=1 Tax=Pleurodeles waltl TaxID=8319 RepID=A0AAV7WPB5_PLEWA|nr:hypothetical protein NDU88_002354 [Pleurodeles waltl]